MELERLQKLSLEHQKKSVAPLPVVRLYFVGRGRAGKTTTLRRLKGESFRDDEPSTHGLDVWAGQVEADLQADSKQTGPWKRWEESMYLSALKDGLRNPLLKGPETDALTAQNADEQPDDMLEPQGLIEPEAGSKDDEQAQSTQGLNEPEHATSVASQGPKANQPDALLESSAAAQPTQGLNKPEEHATSVASQGPNANEQPQEDISSSSGPKMCGPVVLDEDMLSKLGSQKAGMDVRLQCWDFPGQEEYALLNQLHFSERAIYLVFLDLAGQLEDEWRHLSFWLWKIARFSTEKDACPPILLIGTKAGARNRCVTGLELQKRLEDLQSRVPRLKEQLQPHPADLGSKCTKCPWLFPVENKGENFEAWISPLRMQLQRMALQFVSPRDLWEAENSDGSVVPRFVGLQAETFALTWLRAHDLLTRLGSGFRARAERVDVKKVAPSAEPGRRFKIKDYLRVTIDKDWLILPPGAFIGLHSQDEQDDLREEELSLDVSCDFLELKAVQGLLRGMQPQGLSHQDTEEVLKLLSTLGIVVWIDKAKLRETVMLNPQQVAVAMANLIALCFGAHNFEHKDDKIKVIRKIEDISESDLLRFRSSGTATQDLIRGVWKKDFDEASQQLLQEVLLRNDLMCERLVQGEFVLPSCLPIAHCAEEAIRETDEVLYLDVGGLLSPNFFPALAHLIYRNINLENSPTIWKPGPPQVFRNRGDLHSDTHSVFTSMFPVNAPSNQSLLRILVRGKDQKANCGIAQEVKRVLLNDILVFHPGIDIEKDPSLFFRLKGVAGKETLERERSFARHPCLNSQCNLTCSLCRVSELLQERFLPDLSPGLRSIVEHAAVQRHTRPAGSFRFKAMQFPGDVDLEEYLVVDAKSKDEALPTLCRIIQEIFWGLSARNSEVQVFFGGLKAGSNLVEKAPGVQKEWLKWSQQELCDGKKEMCRGASATPVFMTLSKALEEGHETWTAKIDMFAKVRLFEDSEATERFFEITNVLRAGYFEGSKPIQPITKEKDSLQGIEMNLKKYSSEEPNAMKYVKRLWERSAYLAQRGFDLDWHANMLEALRPLLRHWSAELSQIAAHVETLVKMMKSGQRGVIEHAFKDLPTLCQSLRSLQSRLESEKGSEKEAAQDGLERIRDAMKYIPEEPPRESGTEKKLCEGLRKAQLLLESCVETVVISKLGSFEFPVAKRLGELWQFPSDHPPIAAKLTLGERTIKVASWNVLNRNYYKYIDADTQGLKGSQITTLHEAETRENIIIAKIKKMLLKTYIHMLCLQECWPELVAELKAALGESLQFEMICSGDEQDKNQEVIVFDSKVSVLHAHQYAAFSENSKKVVTEVRFQLGMESLRVVTTHVPGAPFGPARSEFADCLTEIVKGETLPTVLLADLNFPEKAVYPLLLDRGLEDINFIPTPYPTNICQGSMLPKRIDCIAVINHKVASKLHAIAMGAEELLEGLDQVVELLQSRSAVPLTPTRYHSDKVETEAEKNCRLEMELHAARRRVKVLQRTVDSQQEALQRANQELAECRGGRSAG